MKPIHLLLWFAVGFLGAWALFAMAQDSEYHPTYGGQRKVVWTDQQFKDYCGRIDPCEVPPDVYVKSEPVPERVSAEDFAELQRKVDQMEQRVTAMELKAAAQ